MWIIFFRLPCKTQLLFQTNPVASESNQFGSTPPVQKSSHSPKETEKAPVLAGEVVDITVISVTSGKADGKFKKEGIYVSDLRRKTAQ